MEKKKLFLLFMNHFVTALSLSFKLPQIYTMYKKKTSKGVSPISNYCDFYSILFQGLYSVHKGLSTSLYLEFFCTSVQNITVIFLSWYYSDKSKTTKTETAIRVLFCITTPLLIWFSLLDGGNKIPEPIWSVLALLGLPGMGISRVSQMIKIHREKSIGAVSLMSFVLRALKNFIKAPLIAYEKFNWQLILNQLWLGFFTLGVIYFILKYKDEKKVDNKEKEELKKKKE